MRSRLLLLVLLVPVLAGVIYWQWRHPTADGSSAAAAAAVKPPEPDRHLELGGVTDPAALAGALAAAYRLPADRRMVAAAADVADLLDPRSTARAQARWAGDRWAVCVSADTAGTLPELPSFADALAMLEPWAKRSLAGHPLAPGAADGITTAYLNDFLPEEALRRVDELGQRAPVTTALLAQAFAALSQLGVILAGDRTELADPLATRALAALALVRASGGAVRAHDLCALAWAMGYRDEARATARALPGTDPLRMLVLSRRAALDSLAAGPHSTREARTYDLLALARSDQLPAWLERARALALPNERGAMSVLATALGFERFDVGEAIGDALFAAALIDVVGAPPEPRADAATLLAFERSQTRPEFAGGGRVSGETIPTARRALFYSGLLAEHDFRSRNLSSITAVMQMNQALLPGSTGPGGWFVRWQDHVAKAKAGLADPAELLADVGSEEIPGPFALRSFDALSERQQRPSVAARAAVRALSARLDTRPGSALEMAFIAQETLLWPSATERLLRQAARGSDADRPHAALLLAEMHGDRAAFAAAVDAPTTEPAEAIRALRAWVGSDSSVADALLPRFAGLFARAPQSFDVMDAYADLLEARGHLAEAERAARTWTTHADDTQDALDSTVALTTIARLERKQGRLAEALEFADWLESTCQYGALQESAELHVLSGQVDQGLAIAARAHERYPDSEKARALPLLLLWQAGRYEEAAKLLMDPRADSLYDNAVFADDFIEAFGGRHAEALRALEAAHAVGPPMIHRTWWVAEAFAQAGDVRFAAELAQRAGVGSGAIRGVGVSETFDLVARASGDSTALAWVGTQHMDAVARELLEGFLLTRGHPGAAYELAIADQVQRSDTYPLLMAAAAWRLEGTRRADRRRTIDSRLASVNDDRYRRLAGYLLDEVPEADVLALAQDRHTQAEVWFYCGVRAWADGKASDALTWMQLVQETGATSDGEWIWSCQLLDRWADSWRSADRLMGRARPPV